MPHKVSCIECGYLFGFCEEGVDLANKEFDPEILRQMDITQIDQVRAGNLLTLRNYTQRLSENIETVAPYKWGDCNYIGCFRHQFPNLKIRIRWEKDEHFEVYRPVFRVDTSGVAKVTHTERDCEFFFSYRKGLSARRHEELEHQLLFDLERDQVQWTEQLRRVYIRFLNRVRQAQTNDEKKQSLEYLAEFLFGTIRGLKIIDRDLRTSAEEIDCLVRNESDEPFWRNLGNPLIVECKNWGISVGAKEVRDLKGKMESRNIRTAFLIAKSGVSGNDYRDARLEIRQALGNGKYIIALSEDDLQDIADGLLPTDKFRTKYEDLFRI